MLTVTQEWTPHWFGLREHVKRRTCQVTYFDGQVAWGLLSVVMSFKNYIQKCENSH